MGELQLYRNLLGHSIRTLQNEGSCDVLQAASQHAASACEIVAIEGPPAFGQVGIWKIADDASVVIGSRMLCLGNAEHPKLTLYLHDSRTFSDMLLLEHWIDCLIAGVPEFAICFHRDGAVQSYSLYKLSELWAFLEERLGIRRKLQMTLEVLRWIKRQCSFEGCTYWLSKVKSEPTLQLVRLSGTRPRSRSNSRELVDLSSLPTSLGNEIILKNTFLDIVNEADRTGDPRRCKSCPARVYGPSTPEEADMHLPDPLRQQVSTLFYRRAASLPPGADAQRFFQLALDFEAMRDNHGVGTESADKIDGWPSDRSCGGRLLFKACCHLGVVLCQLPQKSRGDDACSETPSAALLAELRKDAPLALQNLCTLDAFVGSHLATLSTTRRLADALELLSTANNMSNKSVLDGNHEPVQATAFP